MNINRNKSGIFFLNRNNPTPTPEDNSASALPNPNPTLPNTSNEPTFIRDYPIVTTYKYLGTHISKELLMTQHVKCMERKIMYITMQLKPILLKNKFKLNVNLFKTFVLPQYRLALMMMPLATTH
jgi:hypothetical protein